MWKAVSRTNGEFVALKMFLDPFQTATDVEHTYREICFSKELGPHENIVRLYEVMKTNDEDIYLVSEYMGTFFFCE